MIRAELLSIGDELLIGQVVNTNVSAISSMLGEIGIDTHRITTIGDDSKAIKQAMARAWKESDLVIATGGLGPTHDDISKHVVAAFFRKDLQLHPATLRSVRARFRKFGYKKMPEANVGQAMVPKGFIALPNAKGTAPGLWYQMRNKVFIILPGVPHEMEWLMTKQVIPRLRPLYKGRTSVILHRVLQTAGIGESLLAQKIGAPDRFLSKGATLAFLPRIGGVRLRITMKAKDQATATKALRKAETYIRSKVKEDIYGTEADTVEDAVVALLHKQKATIAVAESCTGGMVAVRITNVAGSSAVFPGGIVAYDNKIKTRELGIAPSMLKKYGAVSEETAIAMAEQVRKIFKTRYGISVTGIAGPSGGTKEKPVGTVWIAIAEAGRPTRTKLLQNTGDRAQIRERTAEIALEFMRRTLTRT